MSEPPSTSPSKSSPSSVESNAIREKLTSWLLADGYTLREGTAQEAAWLLVVEDSAQRRYIVGQKHNRPDVVMLQGTLTLGEEHARQVDALPEPEREEFFYELRFRLLGLGLDFQGVAHPLRQVILNEHLYAEGINRNDFFRALKRVRHGIIAVIWMIGRKLRQPAPAEERRGIEVN